MKFKVGCLFIAFVLVKRGVLRVRNRLFLPVGSMSRQNWQIKYTYYYISAATMPIGII